MCSMGALNWVSVAFVVTSQLNKDMVTPLGWRLRPEEQEQPTFITSDADYY
jgi:hypothetical protein